MNKANKQAYKNGINTFFIQTYGCAMNIADSERFRTILNGLGLKEVRKRENADIIIFNTCSVRQKAEDRVLGLGKEIEKLREKNPNLITVLTGCMARRRFNENIEKSTRIQQTREKRTKSLKRQSKWLNIVIETMDFQNIGKELNRIGLNVPRTPEIPFLEIKRAAPLYKNTATAGITISHGCDHMCTYCIVPYARGREICREFQPILKETKKAIESGAKDIMLLGQTVNRWINPKNKKEFLNGSLVQTKIQNLNKTPFSAQELQTKKEPKDFLQLIQTIDNLKGDFWLSFISSHPNYNTKELIEIVANSVKNRGHIRPYIHLALQSGDNEILKKMNRNHTIEEFIQKIRLIKKLIPEVAVTTDIIVGFPGETETQFQNTAKICKDLEFDQIYISEYSSRKGTGSSFMPDNVPHKVKEQRKDQINEILKKTALKNNKKLIGTKQKVLIVKTPKKSQGKYQSKYQGRTASNKLIEFSSNKCLRINEFANIKVTSATPWAIGGELEN